MDKDGAGALQETAISFSVAVAVVTACFCTAMSCAALCIKCCTWLFGHRGRRRLRRIPLGSSRIDEELTVGSEQTLVPTPIAQDDDNDAVQQPQQQQKRVFRKAEIELRETGYRRVGKQGEGGGENGASGGSATPRPRLSNEAFSASSPGSPPHEQEEDEEKASGDGRLL